ncbi:MULTISPECIES: radical SAM protein [Psychrilyobacter]|uniref:Radical SAM protein n=1 Tax=Psychrilyobacter piezotolerans TaxID=2293438 RepID=A0ABX9KJK7_9FUSO|nr:MULTISPECIES: radical SAM protein [Psychrilyobacter]MCS5421724.1 radical SAM protein [Psychrilyobacter sp. S5]NDI77159.1 radical SAM protein [Psychrilyobacter piezotolerans]RDE64151.1 radical SAM protein [Psychrilyobacter sp. S5]REI42243.1 radical SAM protein [Psychrilyobacter piezotolerans]
MENILLVEPAYKNKYPPIGLMKISTFHKEYKKDYVKFVKGIEDFEDKKWDRIYITTLFTFDFDVVVKTINHYKNYVVNPQSDIIVGGILSSLLPEKIEKATGIKPFTGQVTCASMIGYPEYKNINVDIQPLDYDILSEIEYQYPVGNSYIGYTSRGCPNKCKFCAVPTLEPEFNTTNNITRQIKAINEKYGEKRNLMLMDNNILYSPYLKDITEELKDLGFKRGEKTFKKPNYSKEVLKRIKRREAISKLAYRKDIEKDIILLIDEIKKIKVKKDIEKTLEEFKQNIILEETLGSKLKFIKQNIALLDHFYEKEKRQNKLVRYVDFNQGTDARLLTEEKMSYLSQIDIRPYRIAFDDIKLKNIYLKAMKIAASFGIKHFSNYILFNYQDTPKEFWDRLKLNIDLAEEIGAKDLFSFPMKYAPIENTDRKFIGKSWDKKTISSIYAILNAKKGIVPRNKNYFKNAFGETKEEFLKILSYPRDFIIYRNYFRDLGFTKKWEELFLTLTTEEKKILRRFQCGEKILTENLILIELFNLEKVSKNRMDKLNKHLIKKNIKVSENELYKLSLGLSKFKMCGMKNIEEYVNEKYSKQIRLG